MKSHCILITLATFVIIGILGCKNIPKPDDVLNTTLFVESGLDKIKGEIEFQFSSPVPNSDFLISHYRSTFFLNREEIDTVIGWFFEAENKDLLGDLSYKSNYDGNCLVYFMIADSTVQVSQPEDVRTSFTYGIVFETVYKTIELYFQKLTMPDSLFNRKPRSWLIGNVAMLSDTIIESKECFLFENIKDGFEVDTAGTYHYREKLAIQKGTFLPVYLETSFLKQENNEPMFDQKCKYIFRNISSDKEVMEDLFDNGKITHSTKNTNTSFVQLSVGDKAPDWNLLSLNGDSIGINSIGKEAIVLEFGYVGCGACLLATEELKKTYHKVQYDKVGFYYINPIDNQERSQSYVDKSNIPFTYLLANEEIVSNYGLDSYPKIFIIDQKRRIHKIFNGYSGKNMNNEIHASIMKIMKNVW